jgi:AcrR family transcriptional regulator
MDTANSRDTILHTALRLFSAHGYDGTGIQDITVASGVTKPTLYYFFGSKDGLFEAVWETYFPLLEKPLGGCTTYENHIKDYEHDIYGQLFQIVMVFFDFAKICPEFYRLMMESVYAPPESKASTLSVEYFGRLYILLEHFFTGAAEIHGNLAGRAYTFAVSFLAQINASIGTWLSTPVTDSRRFQLDDACARVMVKQFVHGIFA